MIIDYKKIIRETQKAWLFKLKDDSEIWLPKSLIKRNRGRKTINVPN